MEEDVKIRVREELEVAKARLKADKLLFEKEMLEDAGKQSILPFFPCGQSHA